MTYHDALMSQLISLISVVRTVRERLGGVQEGVVTAIKVPQLSIRRNNIERVLGVLATIDTLHKTQPTIQCQLNRQEFAAALELISTSQDILDSETVNIDCLKHLPSQLDELVAVIEKMLLADFINLFSCECERELELVKISETESESVEKDVKYDEIVMSAIVSGLLRQHNYKFLEHLEEQSITCLKNVIKDVVLSVLDVTEETTLTNLVAEYAGVASSDQWTSLIDLLAGSCLSLVRTRVQPLQELIETCCQELTNSATNQSAEFSQSTNQSSALLSSCNLQSHVLNICDQLVERLGKLVSLRSRPAGMIRFPVE